jgi:hypothetical protein
MCMCVYTGLCVHKCAHEFCVRADIDDNIRYFDACR